MQAKLLKSSRPKSRHTGRRGAAVIEAAVTLPLIFLIILSTVEICNRVFLKQSLAVVAYEGCRVATIPGATMTDIQMQIDEVSAGRAISNVSVSVTPSDFQNAPEGTFITVSVTASGRQAFKTSLFPSTESSKSVSMMKEHE